MIIVLKKRKGENINKKQIHMMKQIKNNRLIEKNINLNNKNKIIDLKLPAGLRLK
jgi:hypothetical protein